MEKRKRIMEHALKLFGEQGFHATSVQEITEQAGMSKGAFYLSFKSKDELIMALIHHFLQDFLAEIDQLVNHSSSDELLINFFEYHFDLFSKQSSVAKIFMKEQNHFLNEDFMAEMASYNELLQGSILTMLEKVYGEKVSETKYDLVYTISGLISSYMEILLFTDFPFNPKELALSLADKTDIIAKNMKHPVVTKAIFTSIHNHQGGVITKEKVLNAMNETLPLLADAIEKESLLLLRKEVESPSLDEVFIRGLLKNIEENPDCERVSFLLHHYLKLT